MPMAVMKGVVKSLRMANLRPRMKALDEPRYGGVYWLGRNARLLHERLQPRNAGASYVAVSILFTALTWLARRTGRFSQLVDPRSRITRLFFAIRQGFVIRRPGETAAVGPGASAVYLNENLLHWIARF
jgi:hypothetical protein